MYSLTMVPTADLPAPPAFVRLAASPLRWRLLTALADSDLRVRELVTRLDEQQNLLSYHLRHLRDEGLVTATRSSHDGRDTYYHLDLDRCAAALTGVAGALHPALGTYAATPPTHGGRRGHVLATCCSCAPATASAHPSLQHCCATTAPTV